MESFVSVFLLIKNVWEKRKNTFLRLWFNRSNVSLRCRRSN